MGVFQLLIICAAIGCGAWALVKWVPMTEGVKKVIPIIAVCAIIVICLYAFGILPMGDVTIPRVR
jgi:hypothetical protein